MRRTAGSRQRDAGWHVAQDRLAAYARGQMCDVAVWSVESHLLACPDCRARLATLVPPPEVGVVEATRSSLLASLPPPVRRPRATAWRRASVLVTAAPALRGAWLAAIAVVLAAALGLAAAGAVWAGRPPLLLLLVPVLPLAGVAACYGPWVDPVHEAVAATPCGGLRLLLWRTLAVLAATIPAAAVVGGLTGGGAPATWLLPSMALTAATLALGSIVALHVAAALVAAAWGLLVAVPSLAAMRPPSVLHPEWEASWWLVLAACALTCALRHDAYDRLTTPLPGRSEHP